MWLYNGEPYEPEEGTYGFIYEIVNLKTGRKYIGRKYLTKAGYKQVKGKRKKIRLESDWRTYFGSNAELLTDVAELGEQYFTRTVLRPCNSRGECNYFEAKYIFERDSVINESYYNSWVSCKIQKSHVKSLIFSNT